MIDLSQFYPTAINQNNFVYATGDQRISGQKDFAVRPTVNGSPVVLYGEFCPGDNSGGTIAPENVVYVTGNQEILGTKNFEDARNFEGAKLLASGEGKYLEKYFQAQLSSNNLEYYSPNYPNSIIFVQASQSNTYSIFLPEKNYSFDADAVKYIFENTPLNNASGLEINFYSDGLLTSFNPTLNDSISFLFRNNNWTIAERRKNGEIPAHTHDVSDIIGLSGLLDGEFINLEKVYHHTFRDGLDILFKSPYEKNTYANLTFDTPSPCYVDLPNPTGNVSDGDRIVLNVKTIAQQPERLIIRHNPFDGNGNYLPYINIYNLPIPNVNDALEFWFQSPEWTLKSSPGGNNVGGSGSFGGGGSGCCPTIPFVGNRAIKRTSWPLNFNPQAGDVATFLNRVFYPFISAEINLNPYGDNLKELGTTFSNIPYVGSIIQNDEVPNGITSLQFLRNGSVIHTIPNPTFGSFNYQSSVSINTTSTLGVRVNTNNDGTPSQITASQTVNFEAPMYYGSGAANLTESSIKALLIKQVETKSNKTRRFSANSQKLYIVVPQGWSLVNIIDNAGFNNFPGWSSRQSTFLLQNGTPQNYIIWETLNLNTVNNFDLTFNFN